MSDLDGYDGFSRALPDGRTEYVVRGFDATGARARVKAAHFVGLKAREAALAAAEAAGLLRAPPG